MPARPLKPGERVRLDFTGCLRDRIGPAGFGADQIALACRRAVPALSRLRREVDAGRYGFDAVLDYRRGLEDSRREARRLGRLADTLIVNGIGGSCLGALAIQTALPSPHRRLVVVDNVDPDGQQARLAALDPKRTAVNVVTKSGTTAETMANLLVLFEWMDRQLGPGHLKRWVATTDATHGDLLVLARRLEIPVLAVPPNVVGRFAVLTPVGLLPAAFLGVDVEEMLEGARQMRRHCWTTAPHRNLGMLGAVLLFLMATRRGRSIQVLMPYADGLRDLADWYRQLWGESLGKRHDRRGREVETGQTPIVSPGAADQHSQLQLYVEGPHDKVVTFLEVETFESDVAIPRLHPDIASLGYLGGRTLGELMHAERRGTELALTAAGRPHFTYLLPRISARVLGQLFYLFQFQTALSGEMYGIDAFDAPGVEAGRVATYALMGRKGYEPVAVAVRRELKRPRAVV